MSIKATSLHGSFVRYSAIELNINSNKKLRKLFFKHY